MESPRHGEVLDGAVPGCELASFIVLQPGQGSPGWGENAAFVQRLRPSVTSEPRPRRRRFGALAGDAGQVWGLARGFHLEAP